MNSRPFFISKAISAASRCRCEDAADTTTLLPDHSSCKFLRSATVSSASRNSSVRCMTPTKPRGGVTVVLLKSLADTRHLFGPTGVPADSIAPGASPPITTSTLEPTPAAEMGKRAGSLACHGRAAWIVSCGSAACGSGGSREFCPLGCGTNDLGGEAGGDNAGCAGAAPTVDARSEISEDGGPAGVEYPTAPAVATAMTLMSRLFAPNTRMVDSGSGGSGIRSGVWASWAPSSATAMSPANARFLFRIHGGSGGSALTLGAALLKF